MLAEGHNRAGLLLIEFACLVISVVMLRGKVFSKATAYAGILGNALLIVVEIILTSTRRLPDAGMVVAGAGGFSIMIWYLLVGRRLLQLGDGKPGSPVVGDWQHGRRNNPGLSFDHDQKHGARRNIEAVKRAGRNSLVVSPPPPT